MKTQSISMFRRSVIYSAISAMLLPGLSWAAPLMLATAPAPGSSKVPVPNVIVSVDDSGSMGNAGMDALKAALQQTFAQNNVPDGSIRLAWQAMTNCFAIPSAACGNLNTMKVFEGAHRQNFMNWIPTLGPIGSTPSHRMLINAGEYLRNPLNVNSAWASVPGTTLEPVMACRRSYNLFMTDGGWNQLWLPAENARGDVDSTAKTLPDGTAYDPTSLNTRVFRGNHTGVFGGRTLSTTLSDLAFYYWSTDLQPGIANEVKPSIKIHGPAAFSSGTTTRDIPEYWNPRNNPATWQHMTMYTVGFNAAATWTVTPQFGTSTWSGNDYNQLMLGMMNWPNPITGSEGNARITELWHMALSSRGKFIPAPNAEALSNAFKDILTEIIRDNSKPVTSVQASSRNLRADAGLFAAGYEASNWTGQITAYPVTAVTGAVGATGLWGTTPPTDTTSARAKSTATFLDDVAFVPDNRVVLTAQSPNAGQTPVGIPFNWASLSTTKQAELDTIGGVADMRGESRVKFVRGDRTKEANQTSIPGDPPNIFRVRDSRQGDIINSDLWVAPSKPESPYSRNSYAAFRTSLATRHQMLYVGGNDGMLHGFDATDGSEKIAYIPDGLTAKLPLLTTDNYQHSYFVDGSPFTADVYNGTAWKTYLAGFPGLGGKGYFVLDVTDPTTFSNVNAASTVVLDNTATTDVDIGYITSQPVLDQTNPKLAIQLTQMNNGRWALVTGNGVNSTNEKAVLLIQYVDGAKELLKIGTNGVGANGNGLSAPRLVDINGDQIPDVAYAGDMLGNLWKFDLTNKTASNWSVAFSGTPLYVAKDLNGVRQPITTAPGWLFHPNGGIMVAVGTGRSITVADRTNNQVQTLYGIYDPTPVTATVANPLTNSNTITLGTDDNSVPAGRSQLVQQTVSLTETATASNGDPLWTVSSNPVPYTGPGAKKGWYMELPVDREAAVANMTWVHGLLFGIPTRVPDVGGDPNVESCEPTGTSGQRYFTILNLINGGAPSVAVFETIDAHGNYVGVEGGPGNNRAKDGGAFASVAADPKSMDLCPPGSDCRKHVPPGFNSLNPTWRQIQ